jgi:hypothetical protein
VRSAITRKVKSIVAHFVKRLKTLHAQQSDQLPDLGSDHAQHPWPLSSRTAGPAGMTYNT